MRSRPIKHQFIRLEERACTSTAPNTRRDWMLGVRDPTANYFGSCHSDERIMTTGPTTAPAIFISEGEPCARPVVGGGSNSLKWDRNDEPPLFQFGPIAKDP